jgi:hypothetical protein
MRERGQQVNALGDPPATSRTVTFSHMAQPGPNCTNCIDKSPGVRGSSCDGKREVLGYVRKLDFAAVDER